MKRCATIWLSVVFLIVLSVSTANAAEDVTLKILLSDDSIEGGAMAHMAQKYTKETGIKIELIEVPYEDQPTKLQTMISGKDAPALVRSTTYDKYIPYLMDMSDIVDLNMFPKSFHAKMNIEGKILLIPSNVTANGMLYNKTAFKQAGVEVPTPDNLWTWDEFVAAVQKVAANSDATCPFVWDHSQHRFSTLLYQFGGSVYSADGSSIALTSPEAVEAVAFFKKLHDDGIMPKSIWLGTEDPSAMFKTGKVAVHMAGNWKLPDYHKNIKDFEWGALYMPYKAQRSSVPGGNFVFAIKGSGVEEEAKAFLKWFFEKDNYTEYCQKGAYLPSMLKISPEYAYSKEDYEVFINELENTPEVAGVDWTIDYYRFFGNFLRDNIDSVINGDKTPEQALKDVAEELSSESGMPIK